VKATLLDFEDSFTYNVVQELTRLGFEVRVELWSDFEELPSEGLLVLGPGPGHPDDYERIFPLLRKWLEEKRPLFGVCLGHQIFWKLNGAEVLRSKEPLHGQKVKLDLSPKWKTWLGVGGTVFVQRYNSLAVLSQSAVAPHGVENFVQDDEILISKGPKILTYQFHPESIGTSFRREFMRAVLGIITP
jgi:anthranilate/para-aminobenzoate synthase component II